MSLSTLKVFQKWTYTTLLETITQQIDLFNAATQGAIVLRSAKNMGDYTDEAFYQRIIGLVRRRNAYGSGAVTAKEIYMGQNTTVKVAAGTPPVQIDKRFWSWIQRDPEEAGALIGKQLAVDQLQDMLNTAIKALVAAITNNGASVINDYSGTGTLTLNQLNKGAAKFGDAAANLAVWVMHSKPWFDLIDASLTNTAQLFTFGTVKVMSDGLGRPFVISDAPDLIVAADTPDSYLSLGLAPGAAIVEQNDDFDSNIDSTNGDENIARTYQAEWTYNLGLLGYTWDKGNGGHSPTNAAIGTGTNWDKTASDNKLTAGVIVKTQ